MSTGEKNMGPKVGQTILFRMVGGAVISGNIYAVLADGRVSLVSFDASGATSRTPVPFNPNLSVDTSWAYPDSL